MQPNECMDETHTVDTLDIFKTGKKSRKSKNSIIPNDLDSIRSTLFGKFYEGIIAKWLQEKEKYTHKKGKPCAYWNEILELKSSDDFSIKLNKSLNDKKQRNKHTNSDGLFEKNGKLYLWEAKHWAKWDEGKAIQTQVKDLLSGSPWILAKKVKHCGKPIAIDGILFSWWQKFEGYDMAEKEIERIINLPFKFYFTSEIIKDCRREKYDWYIKLVNEQKENIDEFFKELLGEK